jgi:hypothetical protein
MEQIFSGLKAVSGETQVVVIDERCIPEICGHFSLIKGTFKQTFNYWAKVYETKNIKGVVYLDDSDYDLESTYIGDCPIDSISKFRETLKNSGMGTVANTLEFSSDEVRNAIEKVIQNNKSLELFFGRGVRVRELIPNEQWVKMLLVDVIDNYDNRSEHEKNNHLFNVRIQDEIGFATREQLIEKLQSLS